MSLFVFIALLVVSPAYLTVESNVKLYAYKVLEGSIVSDRSPL